jgi:hypothetical protein
MYNKPYFNPSFRLFELKCIFNLLHDFRAHNCVTSLTSFNTKTVTISTSTRADQTQKPPIHRKVDFVSKF